MAKGRKGIRSLVVILGILVVLGFALYGAMLYTSRSSFCVICHEMDPSVKAWQSSAHRLVECEKCHADRGLVGLTKTKVQALKEVYRHFTNTYHKPLSFDSDKSVFNARCLGCHEAVKGTGDAHNNAHFSSDIDCTECHDDLVHNSENNRRLPTRKVCVKCHGEEINN